MKLKIPFLIVAMVLGNAIQTFSQESLSYFRPAVFFETKADYGVLIVTSKEMVLVDSKGQKHGRVTAKDTISSAAASPDGKKLLYTTESGVWLANIETGASSLVLGGFSDYLRWNGDGLSFMFAIYEKKESVPNGVYLLKFFWADGDGKNLKQVYP